MKRGPDQSILGQPSWMLSSDCVEMAITHRGAHMAPVRFAVGNGRIVDPYYVSPWQGESFSTKGLWSEVVLRGDFFCMPFGNGDYAEQGEAHPSHGETSGAMWSLAPGNDSSSLTVELATQARAGRVTRQFWLADGQPVVYDRTTVEGFRGPTTMAHHAVLRAPEQEGGLLISNSGMQFGMVYPHPFGDPKMGEYQSLSVGAEFQSLAQVPSAFTHLGEQDCSSWPARRGYTDLLQIANAVPRPGDPAWTVAVNASEGYLWFALKDARVLPSTIFWMENAGRHGAPWLGRNCALGLEDACTFFDRGIAESSASNTFSIRGVATHHDLDGSGFAVSYVQGVAACSAGFGRVSRAEFTSNAVTFFDPTGVGVSVPLQTDFVFGANLQG